MLKQYTSEKPTLKSIKVYTVFLTIYLNLNFKITFTSKVVWTKLEKNSMSKIKHKLV